MRSMTGYRSGVQTAVGAGGRPGDSQRRPRGAVTRTGAGAAEFHRWAHCTLITPVTRVAIGPDVRVSPPERHKRVAGVRVSLCDGQNARRLCWPIRGRWWPTSSASVTANHNAAEAVTRERTLHGQAASSESGLGSPTGTRQLVVSVDAITRRADHRWVLGLLPRRPPRRILVAGTQLRIRNPLGADVHPNLFSRATSCL